MEIHGQILREELLFRAWTQDMLAQKAGVDPKTVSRAINTGLCSQETLGLLTKALGLNKDDLRRICAAPAPEEAPALGPVGEISFDTFMEDRTRGFVGRKALFRAFDEFLTDPSTPCGYFLLTGDPGIGKSAATARLILDKGLQVYHFNIAAQGICTAQQFHINVCARLIRTLGLSHQHLPSDAGTSSALLSKLLHEVSDSLDSTIPLVIAVDALDEAEGAVPTSANPLFLPPTLPANVFFFVTARRRHDLCIQASHIMNYELQASGDENRRDVQQYLREGLGAPGIQRWMATQKLDRDNFVRLLWEKSEGNFMYLHHVIPAISRGEFREGRADALPRGLREYYRHHWKQMRQVDANRFDQEYEPVLCILASATGSVSLELLSCWANLALSQVRRVLQGWSAFIHATAGTSGSQKFSLYHSAFRDFLAEEIDPGLTKHHGIIADSLWENYEARKASATASENGDAGKL